MAIYPRGHEISGAKTAASGDYPLTLHFAITEPSGRTIVVEFTDGIASIHENELGVMCNDPSYPEAVEMFAGFEPKNSIRRPFTHSIIPVKGAI